MGKRLLVCGDRNWSDWDLLAEALDRYDTPDEPVDCVVEGEARGADVLAARWARTRGIEVLGFPANWQEFGKSAGPRRNIEMLNQGCPDEVVAFHDSLRTSKGTRHMVGVAVSRGIPVRLHSHAHPFGRYSPDA